MMTVAMVWALGWPPLAGYAGIRLQMWLGLSPSRQEFYRGWTWTAAIITVVYVIAGHLEPACASAVSFAVAVFLWHRRRRKRRNVLAAVGAKSRALLAAIMRRARDAAQPRRVLRPVPQGTP